jgi:hypothetical protein
MPLMKLLKEKVMSACGTKGGKPQASGGPGAWALLSESGEGIKTT